MIHDAVAHLSYTFPADGFAWLSSLNNGQAARDDSPIEALLDSKVCSLAKPDLLKKLQRVKLISCDSEVHANLMKAFDRYVLSKGRDPGNVRECQWRMDAFEVLHRS
jgi:hypothetical protein